MAVMGMLMPVAGLIKVNFLKTFKKLSKPFCFLSYLNIFQLALNEMEQF
jgi:hypothetical protein